MNDKAYLENCIKRAYAINKKFFGFDIDYKIKLVYSREEFNKEWKLDTPEWMCAFANNGCITIFAPSVFEKLTVHKLKNYESTIIHELNHLFFQKLVGTYKPIWLQEGLAMNVEEMSKKGRTYKYKGGPNNKFLFYTYNEEQFFKSSKEYYMNSYLATKKLLTDIGRIKVIRLLKKYSIKPTKENYIKLFKQALDG